MYDWTVLNKTVGETLASGHVGAPVFVRWTTAAAENSEELKSLLAEMSVYAASWLATGPRRLYANGAEAQGHLSLALEYENGSSALLAVTLSNGRPFMSLVILGARGPFITAIPKFFLVPTAAVEMRWLACARPKTLPPPIRWRQSIDH